MTEASAAELETRLVHRKVFYASAADLPPYDRISDVLDRHPALQGKRLSDSEIIRGSVHVLAQLIPQPAVQQLFLQQITRQRDLSHQHHAETMKEVKTGRKPAKAWRPGRP